PCADSVGSLEIVDCADARQQQHGDACALDGTDNGFDPFQVRVGTEPVIEARAGQTVAVTDLDRIDAAPIESRGDACSLLERARVTDGVHAVTERDVLNVEAGWVHVTGPAASAERVAAMAARRSPVRNAAEVMMSRLPAYFGK